MTKPPPLYLVTTDRAPEPDTGVEIPQIDRLADNPKVLAAFTEQLRRNGMIDPLTGLTREPPGNWRK